MDLSVIIACRNEADRIGHQLDALARQSWDRDWEVIVVDNGSTDGTAAIATAHEGLRGRLRVVDASDGAGAAFARRRGVETSTAPMLAFCDGDDVVAEGWLQAIGDALLRHDLVTGSVDVLELNDPGVAMTRGRSRPGEPPRFGSLTFLRSNNGGMTRAAWDALGGFDEQFPGLEDIELGLRATARSIPIHFVPEAVVHYRYRTDTRSLWRQAYYYGASQARLAQRCRELGLPPPRRLATLKSWAWLILNVPFLYRRRTRLRALWTFGFRLGAIVTSVRVSVHGRHRPAAVS